MKKIRLYTLAGLGIAACASLGIVACDDDDTCTAISLAELLIPQVLNIFYPNGQPMINTTNGQQVQDTNMLVFNQRTGEYFSPYYGSRAGVQLGDFLQIGVQVANQFKPDKCQSLTNAPSSGTGFRVAFRNPAGQVAYTNMPNSFTPAINSGGQALAVTGFQINQPGYYFVQTDADKPNAIKEFDENNNVFTNPNTGTPMGRLPHGELLPSGIVFEVEAPAGWSAKNAADKPAVVPSNVGATAESRQASALVQFVESPAYARHYAQMQQAGSVVQQ